MKTKWTLKSIMKEIVVTLSLLFIVSVTLNYLRKPDIHENIYDYKLEDISNTSIEFSNYKGKPLLVHFWATWCPVCKLEVGNIDSLSKSYNVVTIAVKSASDEALKSFIKEKNLSYRVIHDREGNLASKFNIDAYPTTLIYDSRGELKFTEVGYSTTLGLKGRLELVN
jgi:peroxiredoxin